MPVVVVAYAAYAAYAAYTAYTVFTVIAAIGAIAAAVGTVTGNKDLVKVGSTLGIVGGVGSMASSAGAMGSTSAGAEGAAAESTTGTVAADTPASGTVATETMEGTVPNAAPSVTPTVAPAADAGATAASAPASQAGGTIAAEAAKASSAATVDASSAAIDGVAQESSPAAPSIFGAVQDYAKPMIDFAQKNQVLTYGMMQVGGKMLEGLFDTTKESQKAALDARAEADRAQAAFARQRTANIAAPVPNARVIGPRRDVYGSTTQPTYTAPAVGLLNTPVTGAPA